MQTNNVKFGTLLGCMDGRCQTAAIALAEETFGVDVVDNVTEPGIDGILAGAEHPLADAEKLTKLRGWIRAKAEVSAKGHGSTQVLIVGHCHCAGNPVPLDAHESHLREAKQIVEAWDLFEEVRIAAFNDEFELQLLD